MQNWYFIWKSSHSRISLLFFFVACGAWATLVACFQSGLDVGHDGPHMVMHSTNIKSLDLHCIMHNKIQKEPMLQHTAHPFMAPPFPNLHISPLWSGSNETTWLILADIPSLSSSRIKHYSKGLLFWIICTIAAAVLTHVCYPWQKILKNITQTINVISGVSWTQWSWKKGSLLTSCRNAMHLFRDFWHETLNFACAVVLPGQAFLWQLVDLTTGVAKPYYFIHINREVQEDLYMWAECLVNLMGGYHHGRTMVFLSTSEPVQTRLEPLAKGQCWAHPGSVEFVRAVGHTEQNTVGALPHCSGHADMGQQASQWTHHIPYQQPSIRAYHQPTVPQVQGNHVSST